MSKAIVGFYKKSDLVMKLVIAVFTITFIHHLWGEFVFGGGARLTIAIVFAAVFALTIGLYFLRQKHRWAKYIYWLVVIAFWVGLVGLIEGGYNHAFKVGAWLAGVSPETIASFYNPDEYEPVSDFFFEFTGVLTTIPAIAILVSLFKKKLR